MPINLDVANLKIDNHNKCRDNNRFFRPSDYNAIEISSFISYVSLIKEQCY